MSHTPFNSAELNKAPHVPSNQLEQNSNDVSIQQVENYILSFLTKKDHILLRHFNEGKTHARISISADEFMTSIIDELRRHIYRRCVESEAVSNSTAILINKIFDSIKLNFEILRSLNIPYNRSELVASVQGNLVKHIV